MEDGNIGGDDGIRGIIRVEGRDAAEGYSPRLMSVK